MQVMEGIAKNKVWSYFEEAWTEQIKWKKISLQRFSRISSSSSKRKSNETYKKEKYRTLSKNCFIVNSITRAYDSFSSFKRK